MSENLDLAVKKEADRIKRLLEICDVPLGGSLAKGLQNYQGITLMDTLKMMSLINTKQSTAIVEQIELIDKDLKERTRSDWNPDNPSLPIKRRMTSIEEMMLREDRSRLFVILTQQHNQKLRELTLEIQANARGKDGGGGKKKKPGFSPIEVEANTDGGGT